MHRLFISCLLCGLASVTAVIPCASQDIYTTYSGFTVPDTPVLPATERHPSLFFDTSRIAQLIQRRTSSDYSAMWSTISSSIQSFKSKSGAAMDIDDRPKMAKYCAFGWIVNRDTAARTKAIEALMIAYANVPRTGSSSSFDKPYDEIYRGSWLQNYCEAYDWVQSALTRGQDSTIRYHLAQEAVILRENMVTGARFAPRPHNHRSKPAYGLATAALTLSSDPRAADWLRFALQQINSVTKYQFSADGIYREGAHYYMYSNVNAIPFLWHYKNVSGVDQFPYYQASFECPVLIRSQRGWMPNIEDSYVKPAPTHMVAAAYTGAVTRLHATAPLSNVLQWNWKTTQFFTKDYTGASGDVTWDLDEFLLYDASIPSAAPSIQPTVKLATGQVVFRNGWVNGVQPQRYLIFHGVAAADNHDHPDGLGYVMEANNTILATDAGYGKDGFSDSQRDWYISPESHNIVTVESAAPFDVRTNVTPLDRHYISAGWITLSEKEAATAGSSGKLNRGIAMIDTAYWFIYDRGTASKPAAYRLYLHGRGAMTRTGTSVAWNVPADKYGTGAVLHARIMGSDMPSLSDKTDGYTSLYKDAVSQHYIEARQDKDTVVFGHLLMPAAAGAAAPAVQDWTDGSSIGCEVARNASLWDYFIAQKDPVRRTSGPVTTDGLFAAATKSGTMLSRFAVSEGTIFQWNGETMMTSSAPVTIASARTNDTLIVCEIDSVSQPLTITLNAGAVASVTMDGTPVSYTATGTGSISFTLARAGTVVIALRKTTDVGLRHGTAPEKMTLDPVYPNPFNPAATVRFTLSRLQQAKLEVFDVAGRSVSTLIDRQMQPGTYSCAWNAAGNPSGVYFFRLQTDDAVQHEKAMLIK